jgi:hypothetical protein
MPITRAASRTAPAGAPTAPVDALDASGLPADPLLQAEGGLHSPSAHAVAASGTQGASTRLPWLDRIQAAFGDHDVRGARAHTGAEATDAVDALGASAFTRGADVAFGSGAPDLHLAAHEAAHVVQQQGGVQLAGGVGAEGDRWERHADAVADAVVAGKSAKPLLDEVAAPGSALPTSGAAVQMGRRKTKTNSTTSGTTTSKNTVNAQKSKPKKKKKDRVMRNHILTRGGVNPTNYPKKRVKDDSNKVSMDPTTTSHVNTFITNGGKNNKGTPLTQQIDMCHRTSDLVLRELTRKVKEKSDELRSDTTLSTTDRDNELSKLHTLASNAMSTHWDPSKQTKSQNTKFNDYLDGLKVFTDPNGGTLSKTQETKMNKGLDVLSSASVKNLYPGDHTHNAKRGEGFDYRYTSRDPNTGYAPLSPISDSMAQSVNDLGNYLNVNGTMVDLSSFGIDPNGSFFAKPGYTYSGNTQGT